MSQYTAEDIEVLTGLEPVRKRPGMYTDTTRPNHLAQEVIDNSVDEALAGHASEIDVSLNKDGSVTVTDNGRGMPVDMHPGQGKPGVEVILSTLHAGGKFSDKNYQFSGGLHGVGVSVVNALSSALEVLIRRDGNVYRMTFAGGDKKTDLEVVDTCGKRNTGTTVTFTPDAKYFDSVVFSVSRLRHVLRAKAVLCPGLRVKFTDEKKGETEEWYYEDGLKDYLADATIDCPVIPEEPFVGSFSGSNSAVDWAVQWLPEGGEVVAESYVNLIPTIQGGTHVNGMRTGLLDAMREFCELRSLLPRGIKLAPDDIWDRCCYVLSSKLGDPQFSGQTKERLSSREAAAFVSGVVKDSVQPVAEPAHRGSGKAGGVVHRQCAESPAPVEAGHAQKDHRRPRAARQARGLLGRGPGARRTVPGGRRFRRRFGQAGAQPRVPGHPAAARQDTEHLGSRLAGDSRLAGSAQYFHRARRRPGQR